MFLLQVLLLLLSLVLLLLLVGRRSEIRKDREGERANEPAWLSRAGLPKWARQRADLIPLKNLLFHGRQLRATCILFTILALPGCGESVSRLAHLTARTAPGTGK